MVTKQTNTMTQEFKSIEEIKEEYAKEHGFICWEHLTGDGEHEVKPLIVDQVAQRHSQQYIDANKELVKMLEEIQIDLLNLENPAIPDTQLCFKITKLITKH